MASDKISALSAYTTPIGTDLLPIVDVTTNTTKKIALSNLYKGIQPLVYKAYLTQTGTANPVAIVIYNTIGAIVWARTGVGTYTGTLAGAFLTTKTFVAGSHISESGGGVIDGLINRGRANDNAIAVNTFDFSTSNPADVILNKNEIIIEVYP